MQDSEDFNAEEKKIFDSASEYAEKSGLRLNPDEKVMKAVIKGLERNTQKYGKKICPCRVPTGNREEDEKLVCPCFFHLDEIKKDGHCKCRLFYG